MKLGVLVPLNPTATPEFLRVLGTTAENLGFNSLWVGEHVVMADDYDPNFPVYADGRMEHEQAADNVERPSSAVGERGATFAQAKVVTLWTVRWSDVLDSGLGLLMRRQATPSDFAQQ